MWLWHNVYIHDRSICTFSLTFILRNQLTCQFTLRHGVVNLLIHLSELPLFNKLSPNLPTAGPVLITGSSEQSPEAVAKQRCWLLPPLPQVGAYTCSIVLQLYNLGSVQPPGLSTWKWRDGMSFQMKRLGKEGTQSLLKGGHWCGCGAPCAVPFPWAVGNTGFLLYVSICLANTGAHLHLDMERKFLSFKSLSLFWSASVTREQIWPLTFQEDEFSLSQPQGLRMPSTGCYPPPAQQSLLGHSKHYSAFFTPCVSVSFISFLPFPPRFILSSMWASWFVEPGYIPVKLESTPFIHPLQLGQKFTSLF